MDSLMAHFSYGSAQSISDESLDHQRVEQIDQAVEAGIREGNSQTGLELSGHLYARPLGRMGYDSDEPSSAYTAKAQLELRWNVLQSSIVNKANRIRELQLEGEIEQLQFEKDDLVRVITEYKLHLRDIYNSSLRTLLENHSANLSVISQARSYMLKSGDISSPDILSDLQQQARIDQQLALVNSQTPVPESQVIYIGPIEIDTAALLESIRNTHLDIRAVNLESELSDCRTRSIRWFESASLYPFVRYSYYTRTTQGNMSNLDAGVGFSIPLSTETRNRRRSATARQAVLEYRQAQVTERIIFEVNVILQDIKSCNLSIMAQQRRYDEYCDYLSMRNATYDSLKGPYDRITRLEEYNELLSLRESLLEYSYNRDLRLAELQSYLTQVPVSTFIKNLNP